MIDARSAEVLKMIIDNKQDDILDYETLSYLEQKSYVAYDGKRIAYVTNEGNAVLEDYEAAYEQAATNKKIIKRGWWQFFVSLSVAIAGVVVAIIAIVV